MRREVADEEDTGTNAMCESSGQREQREKETRRFNATLPRYKTY